jgi:hypothetical protein
VSSGQRISLATVEGVRTVEVEGATYIFYEAVSRGGPNFIDPKAATYRRAAGVVARRGAYFYTLAASCPERLWGEVEPLFGAALASFRLDAQPGSAFRDPDTSSLQFW